MQDNKQFIIDKLIPIVAKVANFIQSEVDNFDIAAPALIKEALILNTLHGAFTSLMILQKIGGLEALSEITRDPLLFEKTVLLQIAADFEKRNNDPFKQSTN